MKDHIEELSNLFKNSKLPMPSAVDLADRTLAAEMGISLDGDDTWETNGLTSRTS